jgi:sugar-specific transcriptional regulator TrmB
MEKSILINAGLTPNEAEVYLSLLKEGETLASELASSTNISRPHVYDSIKRLIEKGLVSYVIKDNRRYFIAADPKELLKFLEDEKEKIDEKQKQIKEVLPILAKIKRQKQVKTSVEVFEGKEGLKTVLMDIVHYRKDFVAFGATHKFEEVLPVFSKIFVKRREHVNKRAKILVVKGEKPVATSLNKYRWIPKEYSLPSSTIIYGDKTATLLWSGEPLGIIIKNKEVADSYRSYFSLLWEIGKTQNYPNL